MDEKLSLDMIPPEPTPIDFVVLEDFRNNLPEIISNVKDLKAWAEEQTKLDRTLVLSSEEDVTEAKKRCAQINKVIAAIDGKRKEIKKEYMQPYQTFEAAVKECVAVLTTAKDNLWEQVKAIKAAEKAEVKTVSIAFRVTCTEDELKELKQWLKFKKIKFERA